MRFPVTLPSGTVGECAHYETRRFDHNQVASFEDAEKRHAHGEKQRRCQRCGLYVWDTMWFPKAAT